MVTIKDYNPTYYNRFQTESTIKNSKTITFFEQLYSYPQKLTLKWESLREFETDLPSSLWNSFNPNTYRGDTPLPTTEIAIREKYLLSEYLDGYLKKVNSSKFYNQKTEDIQSALSTVPAFVVTNGDNEIVLSKISAAKKPTSLQSYLNKILYQFCGAFDLNSQPCAETGFFFLNRQDAENYLQSVAKADIDGTKTVGLSINCVGLDSAFKIIREYHPGIDFRYITKLNGLKTLKTTREGVFISIVEYTDSTTQQGNLPKTYRLVFFDEDNAKNFYKKVRSEASLTKSRIFNDSFENFLEVWEEQIHANESINNDFLTNLNTVFVPPTDSEEQVLSYSKNSTVKSLTQSFGQKTRTLKRFFGVFFSVA